MTRVMKGCERISFIDRAAAGRMVLYFLGRFEQRQ